MIVGRDSRVSGPWMRSIVNGILIAMGYEVIDLGIVPTPTVQWMVGQLNADGGIIITSSHNPIEWNGLKFVDKDTLFLSPSGCQKLFSLADGGNFKYNSWDKLGSLIELHDAAQRHINAILNLKYINVNLIKQKKFKICLDSVNGAGGPIMEKLLLQMGCTVIGLNLEPTGKFAHAPEPIPENLNDLCQAVIKHKADLGIAVDPDVDRCVLIDERGCPLGEEYTLALAVEFLLGKTGIRGSVVRNLSSSRASDDIAKKYGCKVYSTPVGEINVAVKMLEVKAVIGGEGNGGVMLPDVHIGRDAPVAAALTLQHLALFGGTISKLKQTLPQYEIVKLKAPIAGLDPDKIVQLIKTEWKNKAEVTSIDESDGLRIDTAEWWVHLRKSNTEPILRVIGESASKEKAVYWCNLFMSQIQAMCKPKL